MNASSPTPGALRHRAKAATVALMAASMLSVVSPASSQSPSPKEIVTAFYDQAFVKGQVREAALRYISPTAYTQHNPMVPDGREAFLAIVPERLRASGVRAEIKRVIAEHDLVVVHARWAIPGDDAAPVRAVMDIFRVQDGLLVQHWDVIQEVPKTAANSNTMF